LYDKQLESRICGCFKRHVRLLMGGTLHDRTIHSCCIFAHPRKARVSILWAGAVLYIGRLETVSPVMRARADRISVVHASV
jgi:hypothetical protein